MRNIIGALQEGEITTDEFTVLAWLGIVGEWRGTTRQLHAALQWPHTPRHLGAVLRGLRRAGLIDSTARERSTAPFSLTLSIPEKPVSIWLSQRDGEAEEALPDSTRYIENNALSVLDTKCIEQSSPLESSEQRTPHSGLRAQGSSQREDDWHAEWHAPGGQAAEPWDTAALAAELDASLPRGPESDLDPEFLERFAPFHRDERTGDGIGDDEASQMRWRAANPRKARARRRRGET